MQTHVTLKRLVMGLIKDTDIQILITDKDRVLAKYRAGYFTEFTLVFRFHAESLMLGMDVLWQAKQPDRRSMSYKFDLAEPDSLDRVTSIIRDAVGWSSFQRGNRVEHTGPDRPESE
jgi:hypothetical protein